MKRVFLTLLLLSIVTSSLCGCNADYIKALIGPRSSVSFDTKCDVTVPTQTVAYAGKAQEPNTPQRDGYEFLGWFIGDEKWSFSGHSVTEDITLSARWSPIEYTIKYLYLPSETAPVLFNNTLTDKYTIESSPNLYVPNNFGAYAFSGWYSNPELSEAVTSIPLGSFGDKTLYAKWEINGMNPSIGNGGIDLPLVDIEPD